MPYECSKFEKNVSMKRPFFSRLNFFFKFGAKKKKKNKKKKNVKKIGQFLKMHISENADEISLKFGM